MAASSVSQQQQQQSEQDAISAAQLASLEMAAASRQRSPAKHALADNRNDPARWHDDASRRQEDPFRRNDDSSCRSERAEEAGTQRQRSAPGFLRHIQQHCAADIPMPISHVWSRLSITLDIAQSSVASEIFDRVIESSCISMLEVAWHAWPTGHQVCADVQMSM